MDKDITPKDPKKTESDEAEARAAEREDRRKTLMWRIKRRTGRKTNARGFSDRLLKERVTPVDWS